MRVLLGVFGLLAIATPSWAGKVVWAFEVPLAEQAGLRYVLDVVTVEQGKAVVRHEPVTLVPIDECRKAGIPNIVADTLCTTTCFDPAEYRVTIHSVRGSLSSEESRPPYVADWTDVAPCRPVTVVQEPPK